MRVVKRFLLIFLTIVLIFILLELLAKIASHTVFKDKINPDILRTEFEEIYVPPVAPKTPDEFRIFVYGGSTVKGLPLPKVGFVSQLEYQLNHVFEGKNIKVFNFGWAGFNSSRIRYIFERTVSQKPDLIIIYTGENEFIYPQLDSYTLVKTTTALKNRSDLAKLIMFVVERTDSSQADQLQSRHQKFPAYSVNKILTWGKIRIFKTNINEIIKEAKVRKVPVILGIPAHNIKDWPPVKRALTTLDTPNAYQENLHKAIHLIDENRLLEANNLIDSSLAKYPDDASFLYLKATIVAKNGQNARQLFEKAKDADPIPWRTTTSYANYLSSLEDNKNVWVMDFAKIFAQNSPEGLTGFNLILDGTHPTKEGAYLISSNIVDFIKKEKLIATEWLTESNNSYSMTDLFKKMDIFQEDDFFVYQSTANLALKMPLFNIDAAKFYIDKAESLNDNNWEAKALKASIANLEGINKLAVAYLKEAEELKGSIIKIEESKYIPYLYEILAN